MGTHVFDTPYDADDPLNGKECVIQKTKQVLNHINEPEPMYVILFDHGPYLEVWPEEIHLKEEQCQHQSSPTSKPSASATN